ncbi:MAG: AI-2E family transporter [Saprospiraceae bacterium]
MTFNPRYLLALIPLFIVGLILYYISDIVTYMLLAWAISMIGAPLVVFLRKYVGKNGAAILTLSLFVAFAGLIIYIFIPPLTQQLENINKVDYNKVADALEKPLKDWENWLVSKNFMLSTVDSISHLVNDTQESRPFSIFIDTLHTDSLPTQIIQIYVDNTVDDTIPEAPKEVYFLDNIKKAAVTYLNPVNIQKSLRTSFSALGDVLVAIFSIFFISFFFLKEQGLFDKILMGIVPVKYEEPTRQAVNETSTLLIRYFIGVLIQIFIIAIYLILVLHFIGVKNALLIASFAALINVIPYIGPIIGTAVGVLITLTSQAQLPFYEELMPLVVKVILAFISIQIIDNILLQPNIFSKSVKAHPLEIFIVVLIGAKVGGILGMVVAIPFYTAFRVVGKVFLSEFKVIQSLTRHL